MLGFPHLPYAVGNSGIGQFHQISVCDGVKTPKFSAPLAGTLTADAASGEAARAGAASSGAARRGAHFLQQPRGAVTTPSSIA